MQITYEWICWLATTAGIILCMLPANERWCCSVTPSLIGWTHTQNDPCSWWGHIRSRHPVKNARTLSLTLNSLSPGRCEWSKFQTNLKWSMAEGWGISYWIGLRWMSLDLTDDKSTLIQVMAWCHQATSRCLNQCSPKSMLQYGVTRPQWVKQLGIIFNMEF